VVKYRLPVLIVGWRSDGVDCPSHLLLEGTCCIQIFGL
jgi:hypothetical protein